MQMTDAPTHVKRDRARRVAAGTACLALAILAAAGAYVESEALLFKGLEHFFPGWASWGDRDPTVSEQLAMASYSALEDSAPAVSAGVFAGLIGHRSALLAAVAALGGTAWGVLHLWVWSSITGPFEFAEELMFAAQLVGRVVGSAAVALVARRLFVRSARRYSRPQR
jgi:hypothetical protein